MYNRVPESAAKNGAPALELHHTSFITTISHQQQVQVPKGEGKT